MSISSCDILAGKACIPCKGGIPPLKGEELKRLHEQLGHHWELVDEHHLEKVFRFPDFKSALDFTNLVGAIAEDENHHPDILTAWGMTKVSIWTHKINGLTESDFVFAAKCQKAYADAVQ